MKSEAVRLPDELKTGLAKTRKFLMRAAFNFTVAHKAFLDGRIMGAGMDTALGELTKRAERYATAKLICKQYIERQHLIRQQQQSKIESEKVHVEQVEAEPVTDISQLISEPESNQTKPE